MDLSGSREEHPALDCFRRNSRPHRRSPGHLEEDGTVSRREYETKERCDQPGPIGCHGHKSRLRGQLIFQLSVYAIYWGVPYMRAAGAGPC